MKHADAFWFVSIEIGSNYAFHLLDSCLQFQFYIINPLISKIL